MRLHPISQCQLLRQMAMWAQTVSFQPFIKLGSLFRVCHVNRHSQVNMSQAFVDILTQTP